MAPVPGQQQLTSSGYLIRVKVMSIHGCQRAPSSLRSHLAVMPFGRDSP